MNNHNYITVQQASQLTKRDESTIRRWIRSGKIISTKFGGYGYVIDSRSLYSYHKFNVEQMDGMNTPVISTTTVAKTLAVNPRTVRRWVASGAVRALRCKRTSAYFFHTDSLRHMKSLIPTK